MCTDLVFYSTSYNAEKGAWTLNISIAQKKLIKGLSIDQFRLEQIIVNCWLDAMWRARGVNHQPLDVVNRLCGRYRVHYINATDMTARDELQEVTGVFPGRKLLMQRTARGETLNSICIAGNHLPQHHHIRIFTNCLPFPIQWLIGLDCCWLH
jgi:hypothetical protein